MVLSGFSRYRDDALWLRVRTVRHTSKAPRQNPCSLFSTLVRQARSNVWSDGRPELLHPEWPDYYWRE